MSENRIHLKRMICKKRFITGIQECYISKSSKIVYHITISTEKDIMYIDSKKTLIKFNFHY